MLGITAKKGVESGIYLSGKFEKGKASYVKFWWQDGDDYIHVPLWVFDKFREKVLMVDEHENVDFRTDLCDGYIELSYNNFLDIVTICIEEITIGATSFTINKKDFFKGLDDFIVEFYG